MYAEEDYLMLSGIQHFKFCRRQWALIHIENQWDENYRTVDGEIMHERAHDNNLTEKRRDRIVTRAMPVFSRKIGISGVCDVVEFICDENGISIFGRDGKYRVIPVEYKRGNIKKGNEDVLQLTAQALCLEEMLLCNIDIGYIYYGEMKRRMEVEITEELKEEVKSAFLEMHEYYKRKYTPKVKRRKSCNACSLKNICLPELDKKESVKTYIDRFLVD